MIKVDDILQISFEQTWKQTNKNAVRPAQNLLNQSGICAFKNFF